MQALFGAGDRDIGKAFPQGLARLAAAHAGGGVKIGRKDLNVLPLAALRLVDGDGGAVQKGRAHVGGKRDERLFLAGFFDLDDARGADLRVFGAHDMQARKTGSAARSQIHHLRALDQAARLQIEALLAVLQRQFDPVANQRLAFQQRIERGVVDAPERVDQLDARYIAPDQNRTARHQVHLDALRPAHALVALGCVLDHALEILKFQRGIGQRMGQIKDRVVGILPVNAVQLQLLRRGQGLENHAARAVDRGQLGRIAEQQKGRENLLEVVHLARVQHRCLVDEPDIQGLFAPFPAGDEIAAFQARSGQRAGDRLVGLVEGKRAV